MTQFPVERPVGKHRDPALVLILSFLTCGIYYLIWVADVSREVNEHLGEMDTAPALEALLTLVTCGLYSFYWDYKINRKLMRMQEDKGLRVTDNTALYLILDFFGIGMVNALIQQNHLNEIWNRR
jgi:hypothetical protein